MFQGRFDTMMSYTVLRLTFVLVWQLQLILLCISAYFWHLLYMVGKEYQYLPCFKIKFFWFYPLISLHFTLFSRALWMRPEVYFSSVLFYNCFCWPEQQFAICANVIPPCSLDVYSMYTVNKVTTLIHLVTSSSECLSLVSQTIYQQFTFNF